MADSIHLALIGDDEAVLDALGHYFSRRNIRTSPFHLATDFLAAVDQGGDFIALYPTSVCSVCPVSI